MREVGLLFSNYLFFTILSCALGAMQSSLWFHVFGFAPAPNLWLFVLVYWTLYRSPTEAVIMTYLSTLVLASMSGIPLQMSFLVCLSIFGSIYLLRDRVLWSGVNSFMLACGLSSLSLPIFTFLWSWVVETPPLSDFHFFDWVLRPLLTSAFALPFYYLFCWVDQWTHKETPKETESEFL